MNMISDPFSTPSYFENIFRNVLCFFALLAFSVYIFSPYLSFQILETARADTSNDSASLPEPENTITPSLEGGDLQIHKSFFEEKGPVKIEGGDLDMSVFSAVGLLVKDIESGKVLLGKNEYESHSMASVSKLMSALVILEHGQEWKATSTAVSDQTFDSFLMPGSVYASEDLWEASLVGSSNKAVLSLIDGMGLSREVFVERMNHKAMELGMLQTVFRDPTGLDEENVSTASDLVILLDEAMRQDKIRLSLEKEEFTIKTLDGDYEKHMWNTDWLLLGWIPHSFAKFSGGKTGYIPAAGYNFVMRVGSEGGQELDVVVLGAATHEKRFTEARDAAEWVFNNYEWRVPTAG
ncbi:MAG: D-alanyl-D-alanine carboxypeptidase [Candidatus Magasanikbacteria bacterium]|nr:D-alanyl-D-alanine carboxypeptidase [Candidatus Magasanikbacteria bacterium]